MAKIDTAASRRRLPVRREPHWTKLAAKQHLGYRKTESGGTWVARATIGSSYKYQSLGTCDDAGGDPFDMASEHAREWFNSLTAAGEHRRGHTVRSCIANYVSHQRIERSEQTGDETRSRLDRHVPVKLLDAKVADLTTTQLKAWQHELVTKTEDPEALRRSKDSANRVLSMLKAALNLSWRDGVVENDSAWRRLQSFKNVTKPRALFLSDEEVSRLLDKTSGGLHQLIKAGVLTGGRLGELVSVRVSDFSAGMGTLMLDGKTGERVAYLSGECIEFFKQAAADKLPQAFLFVRDDGSPWSRGSVRRPLKEAAGRAKMPEGTVFYSLRHYHISKALIARVAPQVIAENCGTSIRMIERHYGKFMATDRRAMMDAVVLGQ